MNVYDFDGTIYKGDSTVDYYLYVLRKKPAVIRFLPKQLWGMLLYILHRIDKTKMKEYFYSFLRGTDNEKMVAEFWKLNICKIYTWYLDSHMNDDIVISASPEFLLLPACDMLGIKHLIASRVDPITGIYTGKNCRGAEKVCRLYAEFGKISIDKFYSDSHSDQPLADIAKEAYLITKGNITKWCSD